MPDVSILLPIKNEAANIPHCFGAIFEQEDCPDFEVVVVDSGSSDQTLELLRHYPVRVFSIPPEAFHHSRTRNLAATLSTGNLLVYLAGDAWPAHRHWLRNLIQPVASGQAVASYGRHLPKPGSRMERLDALNALYGDKPLIKTPETRNVLGYRYYHFSTVNCCLRRDVWEHHRFPEDIRVFEDVAIAKQILDSGATVAYQPDAAVYHSHDYPWSTLLKRYFDIGVIYDQLGIWSESTTATANADGRRILCNKLQALPENPLGVGHALGSDLVKFVGLTLGRNHRYIPTTVKRRLSQFKLYDELKQAVPLILPGLVKDTDET